MELFLEGSKISNLRQIVQQRMQGTGDKCKCIRCREIRNKVINYENLQFHDLTYRAANAEEHFLSFDTPDGGLVGYCRLSLPGQNNILGIPDLEKAAIIREVHVYGQSLEVGTEKKGAAQHIGIGSRLITHAEKISAEQDFPHLAVIAAVGTRGYYANRGFEPAELYMVKNI